MTCSNCDGKGVLGLTRDHRLIDCEVCKGKGYRCPDGGVCHHDCEDGGCFRVKACGSLDADGG